MALALNFFGAANLGEMAKFLAIYAGFAFRKTLDLMDLTSSITNLSGSYAIGFIFRL